ncbi:MAG: prepilin-type N-terminal cleavage/methylation domain-containing protein [Planctomycetes bacterium]|nr:prepilin-type N-terminal cleavage/methylation domain-containing protein [Planctomycetota bacterium]
MIRAIKNHGFSLTEVLIAMAILTTGMMFIAGIFPAAIHLSTVSVERVNASLAAEEAFAKIQLYAQGRPNSNFDDFRPTPLYLDDLPHFSNGNVGDGEQSFPFIVENSDDVFPATKKLRPEVFAYPSDENKDIEDKQYFWSAVLRLAEPYDSMTNPRPLVQVTVFVCRKVRAGLNYHDPNEFFGGGFDPQAVKIDYPMAVPIEVSLVGDDRLQIRNSEMKTFINDGYTIVDDETGRIYRVIERLKGNNDDVIVLDKDWNKWWLDDDGDWDNNATRNSNIRIWVVPVPANGNKRPCVAVYQRILKL